jgi:two-component system NtrC family response regulator
LRERKQDIPLLARHFAAKHGSPALTFSDAALATLAGYQWPGNVRELENVIEQTLILRNSDHIEADNLPERVRGIKTHQKNPVINFPDDGYSLEDLEREAVVEALKRNSWNQTSAARFLRIPRHTLIYRMEKYSISPPDRPASQ